MLGEALQWAALAAGLVALTAQVAHLARPHETARRVALGAGLASAAAIAGAYAYLAHAFFVGRLEIEYVFLYTKTWYPWYYKLAGTWGAQKGTILLWAALLGACLAVLLLQRAPRARRGETATPAAWEHARQWTVFFLLAVYLAFLALVVRQDTFAPTAGFLLSSRPEGNGLNSILQDPLSLVHPPAEFLGYALTAVPAAAALAYLATGTTAWARVCRTWSRVAWAFYTLGLGLGAIWAYYTLSFGGYWAWDPVETANLIPWIALTAFVHARVQYERRGTFALSAPLLGVAGLLFSLFATLATRSGLWVSVHAFTDPTGTFARDPLLRLVNILHAEPQIASIFGLMAALLFVTVALACAHRAGEGRLLRYGAGGACFAAAGAFALAPTTSISVLWEILAIVSGGRTALAAGAFFGLLLLLPALPAARRLVVERRRAEEPARAPRPLFSYPNLVYVAVLLLVAAFFATLILDLRGVNGVDRKVFDNVAPFIVLPMALALIPLFGAGLVSQRVLLLVIAGCAAASAALAAAFPERWVVALAMPPLGVGVALGLTRIQRSLVREAATLRTKLVVAALLVGSLTAFIYWSNPPADVLGVPMSPWLQAAGLLVAAGGLAALPAVGRGESLRVGVAVALANVALVGYGVSAGAGIAALVLLLADRAAWPRSARDAFRDAQPATRSFGIHLLHLAIVLGLVGYAWSTYATTEPEDIFVMGQGDTAQLGGYTLTYERTEEVYDPALGFKTLMTAFVRVEKEGDLVGYGEVHMLWFDEMRHYHPDTRVLALPIDDIYVTSLAMCRDPLVSCATNDDWVEARENNVEPIREDEQLTAFAFRAKILPLMSPVWGSLWLFVLGAGLLVYASLADAPERRIREAIAPSTPAQRSRQELEAELAREIAGPPASGE